MGTYAERIVGHVEADLGGEALLAAAKATPDTSRTSPGTAVVPGAHYMTVAVTPTRLMLWKNTSINEHPRRLIEDIPLVNIARLLDGHSGKLGVRLRDNRLLEVTFRGERSEGHGVVHALHELLRH